MTKTYNINQSYKLKVFLKSLFLCISINTSASINTNKTLVTDNTAIKTEINMLQKHNESLNDSTAKNNSKNVKQEKKSEKGILEDSNSEKGSSIKSVSVSKTNKNEVSDRLVNNYMKQEYLVIDSGNSMESTTLPLKKDYQKSDYKPSINKDKQGNNNKQYENIKLNYTEFDASKQEEEQEHPASLQMGKNSFINSRASNLNNKKQNLISKLSKEEQKRYEDYLKFEACKKDEEIFELIYTNYNYPEIAQHIQNKTLADLEIKKLYDYNQEITEIIKEIMNINGIKELHEEFKKQDNKSEDENKKETVYEQFVSQLSESQYVLTYSVLKEVTDIYQAIQLIIPGKLEQVLGEMGHNLLTGMNEALNKKCLKDLEKYKKKREQIQLQLSQNSESKFDVKILELEKNYTDILKLEEAILELANVIAEECKKPQTKIAEKAKKYIPTEELDLNVRLTRDIESVQVKILDWITEEANNSQEQSLPLVNQEFKEINAIHDQILQNIEAAQLNCYQEYVKPLIEQCQKKIEELYEEHKAEINVIKETTNKHIESLGLAESNRGISLEEKIKIYEEKVHFLTEKMEDESEFKTILDKVLALIEKVTKTIPIELTVHSIFEIEKKNWIEFCDKKINEKIVLCDTIIKEYEEKCIELIELKNKNGEYVGGIIEYVLDDIIQKQNKLFEEMRHENETLRKEREVEQTEVWMKKHGEIIEVIDNKAKMSMERNTEIQAEIQKTIISLQRLESKVESDHEKIRKERIERIERVLQINNQSRNNSGPLKLPLVVVELDKKVEFAPIYLYEDLYHFSSSDEFLDYLASHEFRVSLEDLNLAIADFEKEEKEEKRTREETNTELTLVTTKKESNRSKIEASNIEIQKQINNKSFSFLREEQGECLNNTIKMFESFKVPQLMQIKNGSEFDINLHILEKNIAYVARIKEYLANKLYYISIKKDILRSEKEYSEKEYLEEQHIKTQEQHIKEIQEYLKSFKELIKDEKEGHGIFNKGIMPHRRVGWLDSIKNFFLQKTVMKKSPCTVRTSLLESKTTLIPMDLHMFIMFDKCNIQCIESLKAEIEKIFIEYERTNTSSEAPEKEKSDRLLLMQKDKVCFNGLLLSQYNYNDYESFLESFGTCTTKWNEDLNLNENQVVSQIIRNVHNIILLRYKKLNINEVLSSRQQEFLKSMKAKLNLFITAVENEYALAIQQYNNQNPTIVATPIIRLGNTGSHTQAEPTPEEESNSKIEEIEKLRNLYIEEIQVKIDNFKNKCDSFFYYEFTRNRCEYILRLVDDIREEYDKCNNSIKEIKELEAIKERNTTKISNIYIERIHTRREDTETIRRETSEPETVRDSTERNVSPNVYENITKQIEQTNRGNTEIIGDNTERNVSHISNQRTDTIIEDTETNVKTNIAETLHKDIKQLIDAHLLEESTSEIAGDIKITYEYNITKIIIAITGGSVFTLFIVMRKRIIPLFESITKKFQTFFQNDTKTKNDTKTPQTRGMINNKNYQQPKGKNPKASFFGFFSKGQNKEQPKLQVKKVVPKK